MPTKFSLSRVEREHGMRDSDTLEFSSLANARAYLVKDYEREVARYSEGAIEETSLDENRDSAFLATKNRVKTIKWSIKKRD